MASDSDTLACAWERATDQDVLRAAFPPDLSYSNTALAAVYREFVRRGLQPPPQPNAEPRIPIGLRSERRCVLIGMAAYVVSMCLWLFVTGNPTGVMFLWTSILLDGLWKSLLLLPPGIVAVLTTVRFIRGCRLDPEGHTRCGRCGHILRGLTEPRCPECGNVL